MIYSRCEGGACRSAYAGQSLANLVGSFKISSFSESVSQSLLMVIHVTGRATRSHQGVCHWQQRSAQCVLFTARSLGNSGICLASFRRRVGLSQSLPCGLLVLPEVRLCHSNRSPRLTRMQGPGVQLEEYDNDLLGTYRPTGMQPDAGESPARYHHPLATLHSQYPGLVRRQLRSSATD